MQVKKKIQTLSQEVFTCLHNTKHEIEWNRKVDILDKFMCELKASGYSQYDRLQILKSGMSRYDRLRIEEKGVRPFFLDGCYEKEQRREEKEKKRTNWFNKNNNIYSTVFFSPNTKQ